MVTNFKESKIFNVKDVISIGILIVSLSGTWFSLQSRQNQLEKKVAEMETILKDNNLELINYKLDALIVTVDKLVAKLESAEGHN